MNDDIINLADVRRKRREQARDDLDEGHGQGLYAVAAEGGIVEFRIPCRELDMPAMVISPDGAEQIGRAMLKAAREARRLQSPRCRWCNKHACRRWHVGRRYRGSRNTGPVHAVCEKLTARSARMRDLDTGEKFYVRSYYNWWPTDLPIT